MNEIIQIQTFNANNHQTLRTTVNSFLSELDADCVEYVQHTPVITRDDVIHYATICYRQKIQDKVSTGAK